MLLIERLLSWKPVSPPKEKFAWPPSEKTFFSEPEIGTQSSMAALLTSTSTRPLGLRSNLKSPPTLKMPAASMVRCPEIWLMNPPVVNGIPTHSAPFGSHGAGFALDRLMVLLITCPVWFTLRVTCSVLNVRPSSPTSLTVPTA